MLITSTQKSAPNASKQPTFPAQLLAIALVRAYQAVRGGLDTILVSAFGLSIQCKHSPTCSHYAISAIRQYGTMRGSLKGLARILSCY